ncbi:hypothetical protein GCM10007978_10620 [Shewanella hanedai]|jgi:hypothetical protein|uniref:DUF1904 domain-containing protein n=2 Tax=Shewanella TaxID=22 RepID=A0A553JRK5_SHEHA|nr:DUF1904 family protein [Shewanella hanedai]TRY15094.1 DUF1904 domain-containing protein [Shewanella hanedai]GGI74752.1 hypothetical protein GCM10007978_10620 [Shewanella hanedai]
MPHLRLRGLPEAAVIDLSRSLLRDLAQICNVDQQGFTLDWVPSVSYRDGMPDLSITQVEMLWFPKDPHTHQLVECTIREAVTLAYPELKSLSVMFIELDPSTYFRNGAHF